MSLYSSGRASGLAIDSDYSGTHVVPVYEGFSVPFAAKKNFIGGRVITDHLISLLE